MEQFYDRYSKVPGWIRWLVIVALPIIIFGALYFLVYDPKVKKLDVKEQESAKLEKKYIENAAIRDNLPKFQEEVNILNQQLARAVALLPNEANVHNLYKHLFVEAEKSNIDLLTFKPGKMEKKGFYSELQLEVKLKGTYHKIAEFIDRVGKLDRIINVNDLNFTNRGLEKNETMLEMNTAVTTYTFSGGKASGSVNPNGEAIPGDSRSRRRRRRR